MIKVKMNLLKLPGKFPIDTFFLVCYFNKVNFCGNSSVVERDLAKVDVAGPTPVSRYDPIVNQYLL